MRLAFLRVHVENFKSFVGKPCVLHFEDYNAGLHFLRGRNEVEPRLGSNGSGKSTLWDAVCWCLFGKTPGNLRGTDIKPWVKSKTTTVKVLVRVDRIEYEITRTARPNRLLIDDRDVGQEDVVKLIGLDFAAVTHTIILGQREPLFFDLSPRDKMGLFSEVLQLDRWDERAKLAADKVKTYTTTQHGIGLDLENARGELDRVKKTIADLADKSEAWQTAQDQRGKETGKELKAKRASLDKAQAKLDDATLVWDSAGTERKQLEVDLAKLERGLESLNFEVRTYENEKAEAKTRLAKAHAELDSLAASNICPTCGAIVKPKQLDKHRTELQREVKYWKERAEKTLPRSLVKEIADKDVELKHLTKADAEFKVKLEKAEAARGYWLPLVAELKVRVEVLEKQEKELTEGENPHRAMLLEQRKLKQKVAAEIDQLNAEFDKLTARMTRTSYWVKGFKDIRLYIIDEMLEELELTSNLMLEDMGLVGWRIQYGIDRETKSGTVQMGLNTLILSPRNADPVRWESWSGGEGQRLRLIGTLALSEVLLAHAGVRVNLEVLDEPTKHLSSQGVRDTVQFLAERAGRLNRQTWYVDHTARESQYFATTQTVVKTDKGSRLEL